MAQLLGPDVSAYQPGNIFDLIQPFDFGFVKTSEDDDYISNVADQQIQSLLSKKKGMGFYHFVGTSDPAKQADYWAKNTEGYHGKGIPIADFEGAAVNAMGGAGLLTFLKRAEANIGVKPLAYMSLSVAERSDMQQVVDNDNGLWVAYGSDYTDPHNGWVNVPPTSESGKWKFAIARQFTDHLILSGQAPIDGNVFYGDSSVFASYVGGKPNPNPPKPAPPSPSIPKYPLPTGYWTGWESGPAQQVSGWHGNNAGVKAFQQRLHDRGWTISVDGYYGHKGDTTWSQSETGQVIHAYQVEKHLTADGLGGTATWNSLWRDPVT